MPALRVTQLSGISRHGVLLRGTIEHTLLFPTLCMPDQLFDGFDGKYKALRIEDQVRYTHILCYTTYLGEFKEHTTQGEFAYVRYYDRGTVEGMPLA